MIKIDEELANNLGIFIKGHANNNPAPITCKVTKNYTNDTNHVDVTTNDGDLKYIPCICGNTIGADGIIIFLNGDINSPFAIIDK